MMIMVRYAALDGRDDPDYASKLVDDLSGSVHGPDGTPRRPHRSSAPRPFSSMSVIGSRKGTNIGLSG
jgi:hypothetical protein